MGMERIGGLYVKKSKKGETFLKGKIRDEKVLVFKNKKKENETHPDYNVMIVVEDDVSDYQGDDEAPL